MKKIKMNNEAISRISRFVYSIFLFIFIHKEEYIKDVLLGTTIFLLTGRKEITDKEYLEIRRKVTETTDYTFFKIGMRVGGFFFKRDSCVVDGKYIRLDDLTNLIICRCFSNVVKPSIIDFIHNLYENKTKINKIICSV